MSSAIILLTASAISRGEGCFRDVVLTMGVSKSA